MKKPDTSVQYQLSEYKIDQWWVKEIDDAFDNIELPSNVRRACKVVKNFVTLALDTQLSDASSYKCETCKDSGQTCVGNSGLAEDGNAHVLETYPECGYAESAKHTEPVAWRLLFDDEQLATTNPNERDAWLHQRYDITPLYDHPQDLAPLHAAGFESITDLIAAYEAARQDAARYRWLKAVTSEKREPYSNSFYWSVAREYGGKGEIFRGNRLDIVIDAAIAAAPSSEQTK
jgi:hypothetical protein